MDESRIPHSSATPPSRLYLPKLHDAPATILEHLLMRFPNVAPDTWRDRVSQGLVTLSDGTTLREDSPYRHGLTVYYRRHIASEPAPVEDAPVVYRDDEIIVVDKPHGMPVTPAGTYVERSLLVLLQKSTGLTDLAAMHRLDLETAGLLLLTIKPASRPHYHRLFAEHIIEREYVAHALVPAPPAQPRWRIENRIERGEPWYRQHVVEGTPNAMTEIELVDVQDAIGRFRLFPVTGRKHQLRLHMASIGFPILGDPLYPIVTPNHPARLPLQLLACRLAFVDPLNGAPRSFRSSRQLQPRSDDA
jgi:tRNA pseudouridine32 synthase/23S rRNA pseudouridine746 synthase